MKRLHIFLVTVPCLIFLVTSCETEIGELTEYEAPRLVVNALITAQREDQKMFVGTTFLGESEPLAGAEVVLSANGQSVLEHTTGMDKSFCVPAEAFHPGDVASVRVRKNDMCVSATSAVPFPLVISGIDTMTVRAKRYKASSDYERHTRYLVHLRLDKTASANQMQYFRVEVEKDIYTVGSFTLEGETVTQVGLRKDDDHTHFGYWGDPALTETENADQENMSVSFDWLDGIENVYHVFRSNYFENGEYTLRLDLPEPYFYERRLGMAQDVRIRIYAITSTEYNYLQALAAMKTLDSGTLYDSEPGVTTNVVGGAGIFCVESVSEISFYEDRNLLKVGENYYHRNQQ